MRPNADIADEVVAAEAAAWLARLQGPGRTPAAEAAFKVWLEDPAHGRAFARATELWEILPGAARHHQRRHGAVGSQARRALIAASLIAVIAVAATSSYLLRHPAYGTAVGQRQAIVLADGTRVELNTDSRLVVAYSQGERRVRLQRGEVLFEVAKNPQRPFIVEAGNEQVRALGTVFSVRRNGGGAAVVLLEGRVEVTRPATRAAPATRIAVLAPGERLTVRADSGAQVDHPNIESVTAWRRGEVMFDDAPLISAVGEFNRYGGVRLVVADPAIADLRVSGVFAATDPGEFADAIAQLHHLHVSRTSDEIALTR